MMSGINTNWRNRLRGMVMTNLSVWMGEEPNPIFQKEYVARYDALKAENAEIKEQNAKLAERLAAIEAKLGK